MKENEGLVVYRSSKHSYLIAGKTNLKRHVLVTAKKEERQGKRELWNVQEASIQRALGVYPRMSIQEKGPRSRPSLEGSVRARRRPAVLVVGQWLQLPARSGVS